MRLIALTILASLLVACEAQRVAGTTEQAQNQSVHADPGEGPATRAWECGSRGPSTIAQAEEFVYWTDFSAGTVVKAPRSGGGAAIVASQQRGPCAISADQNNIYWTNNLDGTVMRASIDTGQVSVVARNQRRPAAIGVGQSYIAWMTSDGPRMVDRTTLRAIASIPGDDPEAGAATQGSVGCSVCPVYCRRWVPQIPNGYWETYICGWRSCPPCTSR